MGASGGCKLQLNVLDACVVETVLRTLTGLIGLTLKPRLLPPLLCRFKPQENVLDAYIVQGADGKLTYSIASSAF